VVIINFDETNNVEMWLLFQVTVLLSEAKALANNITGWSVVLDFADVSEKLFSGVMIEGAYV
jgi:hypothetical protein